LKIAEIKILFIKNSLLELFLHVNNSEEKAYKALNNEATRNLNEYKKRHVCRIKRHWCRIKRHWCRIKRHKIKKTLRIKRLRLHKSLIKGNKMKKKQYANVIEMHNNIIEAQYKLSREQQLLLFKIVMEINNGNYESSSTMITKTWEMYVLVTKLNIAETAKYLDIDKRTIRKVIQSLQKVIITHKDLDKKTKTDTQVIGKARYTEDESEAEIMVNDEMAKYLENLSANYTQLNLKEIVTLKSQYSIRIYQLARKLQNIKEPRIKEITYTLEEFQKMIGSKYPTWQDLKKRVIEPSKREINNNTRVWIDFKPIKEESQNKSGRPRVTKIKLQMAITRNIANAK